MLSRVEPEKQFASHAQTIDKVSKWVVPLLALGMCVAPIAVSILYDERYAGAGILLALLLCRLMIRGVGQLQFQYLLAQARVGLASWAYFVALIAQAACIVPLSTRFGVYGLALSAVISTTILTVTQAALCQWKLQTKLSPISITLAWMAAGLIALVMIPTISFA